MTTLASEVGESLVSSFHLELEVEEAMLYGGLFALLDLLLICGSVLFPIYPTRLVSL